MMFDEDFFDMVPGDSTAFMNATKQHWDELVAYTAANPEQALLALLRTVRLFDALNLTHGDRVMLLRDVEIYDGSIRPAGTIGKVSDISYEEMRIELQLEDDTYIDVYPYEIEAL